jgi:ABC-type bacteriocin/lantibiotic exporter with double-glycine peptidase domain
MLVLVLSTAAAQSQGMLQPQVLSSRTVFTVVAILSMVTHPANMIFTILPKAISARTSAERIEDFLNEPECSIGQHRETQSPSSQIGSEMVSCLENANFSLGRNKSNVLHDISLSLSPGLNICIGKIGHGKTTLARAILGEISPITGQATPCQGPTGYCSQSVWLPSTTIRAAITGPFAEHSPSTDEWYDRVVNVCCLDKDVMSMAAGHQTEIGSNGSNLSGGQRQRVVSIACRKYTLDSDSNTRH